MGRLQGSSDVLQTLLVAPPSWIQDCGTRNDVNQDLGRPFRSHCGGGGKWRPFWPPSGMTSFPVSGSGNEFIQDCGRKRKGGHFPPPPQWASKRPPYTTTGRANEVIGSLRSAKYKIRISGLYWANAVIKLSLFIMQRRAFNDHSFIWNWPMMYIM